MKTTLGGDRLGSGNKQEISLKNYERSTHDLGYTWRSSMASGTLVPFMSELALPGDSFDIDLAAHVLTLPTLGPLFGSYKVQLDVFQAPFRLYQGKLHMNMLNIGMNMQAIKLPQLEMESYYLNSDPLGENQQINPSSIFSYLGIRGLGRNNTPGGGEVHRYFNAIPYLAYWEIYKQYYANKQEERGFVVHTGQPVGRSAVIVQVREDNVGVWKNILGEEQSLVQGGLDFEIILSGTTSGNIDFGSVDIELDMSTEVPMDSLITNLEYDGNIRITGRGFISDGDAPQTWAYVNSPVQTFGTVGVSEYMRLEEFDLNNIDTMKMDILADVASVTSYIVDNESIAPYGLALERFTIPGQGSQLNGAAKYSQEGLGIKTYQSDLFNNWISTEWIDGVGGINDITAVSTVGNEFTIDALNLASKVYTMLNRIAISGGSYDDWLDAVYTHERAKSAESPIYLGSLIRELMFEEVVSQSGIEGEPLGTLAGRGRLTNKNKGGKVNIKVNEPSYIIGIVSITPRVDYSQGNKWDVNLEDMDDLHKPALDEIGYQDLITDQMAWWDTIKLDVSDPTIYYKSAGKQPAWINYMTNVNVTKGNFAIPEKEMFMTLNRKYEFGTRTSGVTDLTTYIDPTKYNNIFAEESNLDAQNFWVQIKVDNTARRKMSAKVIPNL